jgi:UDP-2,3-diacylglucosamine hydrolase
LKTIDIKDNKKVYFASDFHLGAPDREKSLVREKKIISWLDSIENDADTIFLCGDLFDFWFEYKRVVPKGFVRFFGKLASLTDKGIRIIVFSGNHDMWMRDYLSVEIGAEVYREPMQFLIDGKKFLIGHGDGLGPGDYAYKFLKKIFESKFSRFLFGRLLHANLGQFLGTSWASHSWRSHEKEGNVDSFESPAKEILFQYCKEVEAKEHHDFYIFGHRHCKLDLIINERSKYINLGDWIRFDSYGVFDDKACTLEKFNE